MCTIFTVINNLRLNDKEKVELLVFFTGNNDTTKVETVLSTIARKLTT